MYLQRFFSILAMISLFTAIQNRVYGNSQYPILVLASEKGYGNYAVEILKAEGFDEFDTGRLTTKTTIKDLKKYDLVILTEQPLTDLQSEMLKKFVKEGGNLIAFRPDKELVAVFGIKDFSGTTEDSYILVNSASPAGNGIVSQPLQYHGIAENYKMAGGEKIASLCKDSFRENQHPAVVLNHYGKGQAVAFLYNLPSSIIATRQGNYRNAGMEMDGITGIRAMDLFTNGWVDTTKNVLNQADEQMHLLSHCIEQLCTNKMPLPRFWYFPDTLKCLVTLNNDGEDTKEAEYNKQFEDVLGKGAKMTLYIKEVDYSSKEWVDKWANKGFEIGAHYDDTKQAGNPDWKTMDSVYKNLNRKMRSAYGIDSIRTVVNHWFVWCGKNEFGEKDYSAQARIEEINGIRLDANYAHYDNGSNQTRFLGSMGLNQGNYTGSGLVMKFANLQGNVMNVYQHFNNVYDQQYMEHDDKDGFFYCFKGLVDRSLDNEVYSFVSIKAHNAEYSFSEKPLTQMLDYANSKKIPVWTELRLLQFLRSRDDAQFTDISWGNSRLSFRIKSRLPDNSSLSCMIPFHFHGKKIARVFVNGTENSFIVRSVKGVSFGLVTIIPGTDYHFEIDYRDLKAVITK